MSLNSHTLNLSLNHMSKPLKLIVFEKIALKQSPKYQVIQTPTGVEVFTQRSDVIDHFKKFLRGLKVRYQIYLLDPHQILKDVYQNEGDYYLIPHSKWSSRFYSNYKKLVNLHQAPKVTPTILEKIPGGDLRLKPEQLKTYMLSNNWLYQTNVPGNFVYGPLYVRLEKALIKAYEETFLSEPVQEYRFSNLVSVKDLIKSDYLYTCCPQLHFSLKVKGDAKALKIKSKLEQGLDPREIIEHSSGVHYALNYCSCHGLWSSFVNHDFKDPIVWFYDKSVPTYRNEKGKIWFLERLQIFHRLESVFLGSTNLESEIEGLKSRLSQFFKNCNIGFTIQKTSSWIMDDTQGAGYTLDFQFNCLGRSIQLGNLSFNSDHWTKAFNITHHNKTAFSGCSGVGLQRLIYVFLLCNGVDSESWPQMIRKHYLE